MGAARISESTDRYLDEVADDIRTLLGPGIELDALRLERPIGRRYELGLTLRMGGVAVESRGRGRSLIEAHARLREAVVVDRISLGLRALTGSG